MNVTYLKEQHLKDFTQNREYYRELFRNIQPPYLQNFADRFPAVVQYDEPIVGIDWQWQGGDEHTNTGHFIADYNTMLTYGIDGMLARTEGKFNEAMRAFKTYVSKYEAGFTHAPRTFKEALQLVWFTHIFLHVEAESAAVSFGRFDQYMYPYLKHDLDCGAMTIDEARELIECFYIKTSEGDESQNLVVGGNDNLMTVLCMEAQTIIKMRQPTISVRINSKTSDEVWSAALALAATGIGMPSFFCDDVVISGLMKLGIPRERAEDYGIVGCYEACPNGDTHALTTAYGYNLNDILLAYINEHDTITSYSEFYDGFKNYYCSYYLEKLLPDMQRFRNHIADSMDSPFLACMMKGCLEKQLTPEKYGAVYSLFGVNILGIGNLIDGIYCIKKLVYDEKRYTYAQVKEALANNFDDEEMYSAFRKLNGRYGSNSEETNRLADEISGFIGELAMNNPLENGVKVSPALFRFLHDVNAGEYPATPDGRRKGERLSYGIAPSEYADRKILTSTLLSMSHIHTELFPDGCPFTVSMSKADLKVLKEIITTFFQLGGFHMNVNIVDSKTLKKAVETPDDYQDLLIKISGYSAKFVTLDTTLQKALIDRTSQGY